MNTYKESINASAKRYGLNLSMVSELIIAESSFHTLDKDKCNWFVSIFKKLFRIKKEIKPCNTFGLGQFSINMSNKESKE